METNDVTTFSVVGVRTAEDLQGRIIEHAAKRDFISFNEHQAIVKELRSLDADLEDIGLSTYYNIDSDFVDGQCMKCGDAGLFRWHFLGKLKHTECQASSYVSTSYYLKRQIGATFGSGVDTARDFVKPDKNGEAPGILGKILLGTWGFMFGFVIRLFGALIVLPFQLIAYLAQGEKVERIAVLELKDDAQLN